MKRHPLPLTRPTATTARRMTGLVLVLALVLQVLLMGAAMGRGAALASSLPPGDVTGLTSLDQVLCKAEGSTKAPAKRPGAGDCCAMGCTLATGAPMPGAPAMGGPLVRPAPVGPLQARPIPEVLRLAGGQGIRGPPITG